MNLAGQLEGILNYSKGMKQETRDAALKETIEYYIGWQQRILNSAQEDYCKGISSELYLRTRENEQELLQKALKGETTFQKEWEKLIQDPEKRDKHIRQDPLGEYAVLDHTLRMFFSEFSNEGEGKAKIMDEIINRLYFK